MRWTISLLCCRAPWPTRCSCPTHMDTVGADIGISAHHRHGVIRTDGSTILGANDKSGIAGCLELLRLLLLPAHQPRLLEQRLGEDPATSHKLTARTAHGGGERRGPGVLPHHQAAELPGSIAAASEVTSSSLSSIARSESYVRSSANLPRYPSRKAQTPQSTGRPPCGQRLALPAPEMGRFGDDFLRRAADRSLAGVTANNPAGAIYLINFRDADRPGSSLTAAASCALTPADCRP
jgi:hypothetical protein